MQRWSFPRTIFRLMAVIVAVGSLTILSCPGGNEHGVSNVKPAAVEDLRNQTFVFDNGAAFGLPNETVTLEVGNRIASGQAAAFVLSFGDETATGTLSTESCRLGIAMSSIPEIAAGDTLVLDPCTIDTRAHVLTFVNVALGPSTTISSRPPGCDPCQGCTGTGGGTL